MGEANFVWMLMAVLFLLAFIALAFIFFLNYSQKKIVSGQLELKNLEIEHQKNMLQKIVQVQEEERTRIARNLHDAVSAKINLAALHLRQLVYAGDDTESPIGESIDLLADASETARTISHELVPPMIDKLGWPYALEEMVQKVNRTTGIKCHFSNQLKAESEQGENAVHVFRIFQELINNTIKHAQAASISITLAESENGLELSYSDNGNGTDVSTFSTGLGMSNIQSRLDILSGKVAFASKPGQGFQARIEIPGNKNHCHDI